MRRTVSATFNATVEECVASLSKRQRQVLLGLVAGHPNKTITFNLGISPRTVEIYRADVMTKMQAKSLSDLVRMALVAGLLNEATGSSSASG
jgi:two-component system, LuxR family, response regulator FixJ